MSLYYRFLGLAAALNAILGAIRLHHIPLNWLVMGLLALATVGQAVGFGPNGAGGAFADPEAGRILRIALCALMFVLLVIVLVRRNVIFRPLDSLRGSGAVALADVEGVGRIVAPRASAVFRRDSGQTLRLHNFPTAWEISETGAISLVTRVVGGDFHGFIGPSEDPSGMWCLALPRELLEHGLEDGILYYGLSARPALRGFPPGKSEAVILSVDTLSDLLAFRRTLDEVVADSARKQASFFAKVEATQSTVTAHPDRKVSAPGGNAEERIAWENLIDFTK
jgi:hypothetical protein